VSPQAGFAIVESAEVIGLALLPPALRHPLWPDDQPPEDVLLAEQPPDDVAPDDVAPDDSAPAGVALVDVAPDVATLNGLTARGAPAAGVAPPKRRNDSQDLEKQNLEHQGLDSRGLAPVLLAAAQAGAEHLLIGLGGSATNDGGFGLARALGWRFFDGDGAAILHWSQLERLERLEPPPQPPPLPQLVIAVDVHNPLLGPEGATAVYGPQKGLTARQLPRAEACLRRLAQCLEARFPGVAERPGSGAAGGLGYGLQVFCGGRLRAGAELVAELCGLEARLEAADLVIAGEGRFDGQSLMGKGTGRLLRRAQRAGRPSLLLVGQLDGAAWRRAQAEAAAQGCAIAARALVPDCTGLPQACDAPALWLERLAQRAAADLDALSPGAESGR
jgi:glycerate kinase